MNPLAAPEFEREPGDDASAAAAERNDRLFTEREFAEALRQDAARDGSELAADARERSAANTGPGVMGADPRGASPPSAETDANDGPSAAEFIDFSQLEATAAHIMSRMRGHSATTPGVARTPPAVRSHDALAEILYDFEERVRAQLERRAHERETLLERRYQERVQSVRRKAAVELRKREATLRAGLEDVYRKKERALRVQYQKLQILAKKIGEQKAQLQRARAQFEEKLAAVNVLHRQVEEMRRQLSEHLGPESETFASGPRF